MDQQTKQAIEMGLRQVWQQVSSILLSASHRMGTQQACSELTVIEPAKREQFILENWGPVALEKLAPLLEQIARLEAQLGG